jgi:hypothetical protein
LQWPEQDLPELAYALLGVGLQHGHDRGCVGCPMIAHSGWQCCLGVAERRQPGR